MQTSSSSKEPGLLDADKAASAQNGHSQQSAEGGGGCCRWIVVILCMPLLFVLSAVRAVSGAAVACS